jgi:hypothetical protein
MLELPRYEEHSPLFVIALAALLGTLVVALSGGCGPARPRVIAVMKNPETGQRTEMYKEIWYKVPADYDQKKHIEQWKAEQHKKGFTVEVRD